MTAPRLGTRALSRVVVLVLAAALAVTLLGAAPSTARGVQAAPAAAAAPSSGPDADAPPAPPVSATYRRGDLEGVDAPVLPPGCFGPARTGIDPFPCPLNKFRKKRPTILLWGDSHAYQWIPALKQAVQGQKVNLVSFVAGSCPPVLITNNNGRGACRRSNYVALRTVQALKREKKRFKVVVGSNWSGFRRAYRRIFLEQTTGTPSGYDDFTRDMILLAHEGTPALFERFGKMGIDVDIIGQAATVPEDRAACAAGEEPYSCDLPRWRALPEERRTDGYLQRQREKLRGRSRIIDATPGYCNTSTCHGKIGSIQTYFDDLHLSATRTRNLARYFKSAVADMHRKR